MFKHYLQPLLAPASVALVGASERPGSLGAIVLRNLAAGTGSLRSPELYAVNPKHRSVAGRPSYPRLTKLPRPPDLAVIATPARTVPQIIEDAAAAGIKAALVLTSGFGESGAEGEKIQDEMLAAAKRGGGRIPGPDCPGLIATNARVDPPFARTPARPGKL